jgi:thymidylate kinase
VSARPNEPDQTLWVAVEGPCCAGKTTVIRNLVRDLSGLRTGLRTLCVPCFADWVGGGRHLPRAVPESIGEDQQALATLLQIEADRMATARMARADRPDQPDLVLMDRSAHTLLAHRYGLQRITGLACFGPATRVLSQSDVPAWPDLVLYLDVTQQTIQDRNRGKFPEDSVFLDARFNTGIRDYWLLASENTDSIVWLDADIEAESLMGLAKTHIAERLADISIR